MTQVGDERLDGYGWRMFSGQGFEGRTSPVDWDHFRRSIGVQETLVATPSIDYETYLYVSREEIAAGPFSFS
jgi:hypothetical protein